jgi:peptidoglycan biosynthesis protein MviN/MurJ (putative lipid II flippase)
MGQIASRKSNVKAVAFIAVAAVVLWFLGHYPLFPATGAGWAAAFGSMAVFVLCGALLYPALTRIGDRTTWQRTWAAAGIVLACSLGVGVFVAEYVWRDFIAENFIRL